MPEPAARSPIALAAPMLVIAGWEASGRRAGGVLTLTDGTPLAKTQIRAPWGGQAAAETGVPFGRAARDRHGTLLAGPAGGVAAAGARSEPGPDQLGDEPRRPPAGELVTAIDLTTAVP